MAAPGRGGGRRCAANSISGLADVPDNLVLRRHRDLDGPLRYGIWGRRAILAIIALLCLLGLANRFGQATSTSRVRFGGGSLAVTAPSALRGGDLFSAEFTVTAAKAIAKPVLVLDQGWARGLAINTIEPSPTSEASRDGRLALTLGPIPAGRKSTLFMQFQVNPTTVSWRRSQNVQLVNGTTVLTTVHRTLTVYP
jgi:hypothetical protein